MFFVLSCVGNKKKFWVPMRNWTSDLQIPYSDVLPLSHRDSTVSIRSITKFIWHVSYTLLGSAMSIASWGIFSFVPHLWQDEKDLSLFFYPAQNLPSLLFTINGMLRWLKQLCFNLSSSIHMVYWHNPCWLSYWKL